MILITYGTRPEYIKVKPLIDEMRTRGIAFKTLFTGQHKDIAPKDADYVLEMTQFDGNRLDSVMKNCLSIPDYCFEGIDYVLVQGDTTSVVGLSIAAMHRKIKVIHLEAGLRTHDFENPFPEEYNRKIVSSIASLHLCPTNLNFKNLTDEGITQLKAVVGNTVLDNLLPYKKDCEYGNTVLITLHRRENHELMGEWFKHISDIAAVHPHLKFVLPIHPNPDVQKHRDKLNSWVNVIDPLPHDELIQMLIKARLVITDSGGIQEECSFFNKKALVCRKITERPESLGLTSFMVKTPDDLKRMFDEHINTYEVDIKCPYGDGSASKNICDVFERYLL